MKTSEMLLLAGGAALLLGGGGGSAGGGITAPEGPSPGVDGPGGEEPVNPGVGPATIDRGAVWASLVRDTATFGFLYCIKAGDTPTGIARAVLGVGQGDPRIVPYLRSLTASRFNWMTYATQAQGTYSWSWNGVSGFIGPAAWLPGNDNVRAAFMQQALPHRRYNFSRKPNPNDGQLMAPTSNGAPTHGPATWGCIFITPEELGDPNAPERNPVAYLNALGKSITDLKPDM